MRAAVPLAIAVAACGGGDPAGVDLDRPLAIDVDAPMPERLSALNLFAWDPAAGAFTFHDGVIPYELNAPLFSDYALKQRAIYVPAGAGGAAFEPARALDFPVGSVVMKSFLFPADLRAPTSDVTIVETRLMVHTSTGWQAFPYIWDEAQQDAVLSPGGAVRTIAFIDATGAAATSSYLIPQKNQCGTCHAQKVDLASDPTLSLLGPSARQLHRPHAYPDGTADQLTRLGDAGFVTGVPALDTITPAYDLVAVEAGGVGAIPPADLDRAARSYLDANCAHCHNPLGVQGISSQLFLDHATTDPFHLGICKQPGSAGAGTGGFKYDIVPGSAAESVLHFRIRTTAAGAMMPLIGRSLEHTRGSELIGAWIDAMPPTDPVRCGLP